MLKKNKKDIIITSVITILPIIIGLILWNKLPDSIATHFNEKGVADGWSNKAFAVFGLPLILLATHMLCIIVTALDPKSNKNGSKVIKMVLWITPVMSIITNSMIYMNALGIKVDVGFFMNILVGVMFLIIGNYLPKVKRNYTIGIKLPWTLEDDEVWYKTHRMSGLVWIIGGAVLIVNAWIKSMVVLIVVAIIMVLIPTVYSYRLYKKKAESNDTQDEENLEDKNS